MPNLNLCIGAVEDASFASTSDAKWESRNVVTSALYIFNRPAVRSYYGILSEICMAFTPITGYPRNSMVNE